MPTGRATSDGSGRCAECGGSLAAPDAVCPACDAALAAPSPDLLHGRYRCPGCHAHFMRPTPAPWPAPVPWYRPQFVRPHCPHCRAVLRDRWFPPMPSWLAALLILALLGFVAWGPSRGVLWLLVGAMVALQAGIAWRSASRGIETRYGLEPGSSLTVPPDARP